MKAKFQYNWIGNLVVFLLAATCLLTMILKSNQSSLSKPLLRIFTGEYSRDGEMWNAPEGDLLLRGHFSYDRIAGRT